MAVITLPSVQAMSMTLQLIRADQPIKFFGGGEVISASTEALWTCGMTLRPLKPGAGGRDWFRALTQLSNLENTCKITPVGLEIGANYAGANPVVNGASQLGLTLAVDGASNNTTIGLAGDPVEVGGEYKILTQDAITNGSGQVTIEFEPALRQSPGDGTTVDVKTPKITARLAAATAPISSLLGGFYNMDIVFVETFRP